MDDVLCKYTESFHECMTQFINFPQSQYGFFANLEPMEGAIDAMEALLMSPMLDPYILTAPSYMNPLCYSEKRVWVEKHLGMEYVKRLIICPNKGLMNGHYLIDDNIFGKGQERFQGELLQFGSSEYPTWNEVRAKLLF